MSADTTPKKPQTPRKPKTRTRTTKTKKLKYTDKTSELLYQYFQQHPSAGHFTGDPNDWIAGYRLIEFLPDTHPTLTGTYILQILRTGLVTALPFRTYREASSVFAVHKRRFLSYLDRRYPLVAENGD